MRAPGRRPLALLAAALLLAPLGAGCTRSSAPGASTAASAVPSRAAAPSTASSSAHPSRAARTPAGSTPRRSARTASRIPPLPATARAAGLVDIRSVVPDAVVDLRYATSDNFVGVRLYPVGARCLVHTSMATGLNTAAAILRQAGYRIVFWDCYRPHAVQVRMFQIVPDPNWVARPGPYATSHEAARSVDVTLAHASTGVSCPAAQRVQRHCLLDMGTGFDDFTPRAYAFATDGVGPQARANRARLRRAMDAGGITVYSGEWWHFDGPGADVPRPQLDAPLG